MQKSSPAPADPPDGLPLPERHWAMAAILLGMLACVMDSSMISLALPDITRDLGVSTSAAVWVVNANQLATLGLLLPCSRVGERIGYRNIYLAGLLVFIAGALCSLFAPSLGTLVAARALQGVGSAGMMSVNSALVRLTFPADRLPRAIAINAVVVAVALVAGPGVAALILSVAQWPWLFATQLPLALAVVVLGRRALPRSVPRPGSHLSALDVLLNVSMFSLVFLGADVLGIRSGRGPETARLAMAAALLAGGVAVGAWYLQRQRKLAEPVFPVDLLRIPVFALSVAASVTSFAAYSLAFICLPFLLLEVQGRGHLEAGLLITAWPAAIVVVAPLAGRLMTRVPAGVLEATGLGLLALGLAALAWLPAAPDALAIAWRMALCGVGFGLFQSPNNHTLITSVPLHRAGAASGMLGTARLAGQSLGAVLLGILFSVRGIQEGGAPLALGLAAALAVLAALLSLLRTRTS